MQIEFPLAQIADWLLLTRVLLDNNVNIIIKFVCNFISIILFSSILCKLFDILIR